MAGSTRGDDDEFVEEAGERDEVVAEQRLALEDEDDDHLPWLESDDDAPEEGFDPRLIVFAIIGVLVLAGLLFAIWSLTRSTGEGEQLAQGSVIEAPDEPYRTRPENPGGEEVAGTGDLAFEVGEGEVREGQIVSDTPSPSIDREQGGEAPESGEEETPAASAPAPASGTAVQVGAFSTRETAEAAWSQFAGRYSALAGVSHRVVEGRADSGTIYRLQAIAGSRAAAGDMCRSIRSEGGDCQVK